MTVMVVVEDGEQPARFSVMAGTLATEHQLPLICVRSDWPTQRFPDARQHVLAGGGLATSGLLWPERLSGRWLAPECVPATALALPADCVVATPPQRLEPTLKALDEVDGVLLPGGSAMANVAGQIAVARDTLLRGIPTLGLCLGMQTMATAALQQLASLRAASLAEADPAAPVKTFVPLCQPALTGVHRSGRLSLHSQPGTLMAALLGESSPLHYNHRYQFNPLLNEALTQTGIRVSALGGEGTVVDAIEASDGRFWCGVQGHPELGSRQDAPHLLVTALLRRAAGEE